MSTRHKVVAERPPSGLPPIDADERPMVGAGLPRKVSASKLGGSTRETLLKGFHAAAAAADRLMASTELDDLYRRAVEEARDILGLERCSIYLKDDDSLAVRGTYGTDRQGRTTDERRYRIAIDETWEQRLQPLDPNSSRWSVSNESHTEWDGERPVIIGQGWIAITPLQSERGPIGVFCNDSAISGSPVDEQKQEVLCFYCGLLASILERKRIENTLRTQGMGLRAVVEAADQLIACPDMDSLLHRAVVFARETLELERCGILLKDEQGVYGTYGTDRHGRIIDEHKLRIENSNPWTKRLEILRLDGPRWTVFDEDHYSYDGENFEIIGHGWIVMTPIRSSTEPIGVLCNDTALSGAPLNEARQEVVAVFCSLLGDIIKRKRAEEALRRSEERYRCLVETAKDVIFTLAKDGTITSLNPAFESMCGWPSEQWITKPFSPLIHPDDLPGALDIFQRVSHGESPPMFELRILNRSGNYRVVEFTATAQLQNAEIVGVLGVARDVTERKRLEGEILEISDREQQRIGQDLHDGLCQHLTATEFAASLLEQSLIAKSLPEAAAASQIIGLINKGNSQARDLAKCFYPIELENSGLTAAVRLLASNVMNLYGISCDFDCPEEIGVPDKSVERHLYRIAQEALNNAIRHGRPSKVLIQIVESAGKLVMTIRDDGIGLPPDANRHKGMGMNIMRYRAGKIGASLDFRRNLTGGTTVTCTYHVP